MKTLKRLKQILLITIILFSIHNIGNAQRYKGQRFKIRLAAGANIAQIDGDNLFGYRKIGFQGGLEGIAMINKNQYLSLSFLFSQRGAVSSASGVSPQKVTYTNIRLNYVEIPILFNQGVKLNKRSPANFYIQAGFSINRLLSSSIEGVNKPRKANPVLALKDRKDELATFEIGFVAGGVFKINEQFGFLIRHNVGINTIFEPLETDELLLPLRNFVLTFGCFYLIN